MFLVKENPEAVLIFIKDEASDEEVYWLSEKLCDIYDLTQDELFVRAFQDRADNMEDVEMKRSILQEVSHV